VSTAARQVERLEKALTVEEDTGPGLDASLAAYADRPDAFAREVCGVELWSHQRRTLEALVSNRRVSWRSCHGAGKSITAQTAAAWWATTRPDSLVLITAPSARQVRAVLWRGLRRLVSRARVSLGGEILDVPEAGWRFPDGRLVVGLTAGDAERFAGFHARHVMVIVDEASGVEGEIYEAIKGALTGDSRLLLIGNPTRLDGEFYDSHNRKAQLYCGLHTSAFDVPNVSGLEPALPGLIDQQLIDEMKLDYGEESAVVQIRVFGNFAQQSADAVIPLLLVEAARERYDAKLAAQATERLEVGVDVARFGDDASCIAMRRGVHAFPLVEARGLDLVTFARRVVEAVTNVRRTGERPVVRVDTVGVGGGVADVLRSSSDFEVVDVNAGATPARETYLRTRDELWFCMRDWLRDGGALPPDPKLEAELIAPTYGYTPAMKLAVESKDEIRKRLRRSPDRADALALAVYAPAALSLSPKYDEFEPSGFFRRM
jgi:phage terminase large subunit